MSDKAIEASAIRLDELIQDGVTLTCGDMAKAVVDAYEAALWVNTETPPDNDKLVLVTDGEFCAKAFYEEGVWFYTNELLTKPTHFRLLPTPPKE